MIELSQMSSMASLRTAVERGATLLDRKAAPNWFNKIDLNTVSIDCVTHCPLGQIYGHFLTGYPLLFSKEHNGMEDVKRAAVYGFDADILSNPEIYDGLTTEQRHQLYLAEAKALTKLWKELILQRRMHEIDAHFFTVPGTTAEVRAEVRLAA
jgi:hypothetical protein